MPNRENEDDEGSRNPDPETGSGKKADDERKRWELIALAVRVLIVVLEIARGGWHWPSP